MGYRRDLWEIAASNHGIVAVAAADDVGVPAVELRKLAAKGALHGYGQGVYMHSDVPQTRFTQPAAAVALAGAEAFFQCESVLDLLGLGQFNPRRILVGTPRRMHGHCLRGCSWRFNLGSTKTSSRSIRGFRQQLFGVLSTSYDFECRPTGGRR